MFQLLRDYQGQDVSGGGGGACGAWLMSPKLDGFRLFWTGEDYVLRGGGVLRVPDSWKIGMPGCALDGELWAGNGGLYEIQGRIARGFHGLSFQVFDAPAALPFRQRLKFLQSVPLPDHCQLVPHIRCRGTEHMLEHADEVVANGGEGVVVRDPRAIYQAGRCGSVLRWVPQDPAVNRRRAA